MGKVATPEEMAKWPEPNYKDPETRVDVLLGLSLSTTIIMGLFIGARFYGRGKLKSLLGPDDYIMGAAAVLGLGLCIIACISVNWGLGYHIWDLKSEWNTPYQKAGFAADFLFPLCVGATKISICLTYLRLFPTRANKFFCYGMIVFLGVYTAVCVLLMLFQCKPIRGYWDSSVKIQCIDMRVTLVTIAALNSLSDFLVFLWPAKYLRNVQLPLKQRIGLVIVFGVGCFVCVAGVCRMYYLEVYFASYDGLWNASIVYSIIVLESNVGIICGCLPGVKPVLAALFPKFFGSSANTRSRPSYGRSNYGNNSTHPFQSLAGRSKVGKGDESIEAIELERAERNNYAWAGAGNTRTLDVPKNAIAISQVVQIEREESKTEDTCEVVSKGDGDSEEWIIRPDRSPSPAARK